MRGSYPLIMELNSMTKKKNKNLEIEEDEIIDKGDEEHEDIYDEESREEMVENDEITAAEEGFMRGWDGTVEGGKKHKKDSDHNDTTSVELVKDQYNED
jgi:hypothetical protein